jgi:hypothetical protein
MRAAGWVVTAVVVFGAGVAAQQGETWVNLFDLGGYNYMEPPRASSPASRPNAIPANIRALHGKRVAMEGFMIPYDQAATRVSAFMLVASYDACGFGDLPTRMNDWVDVTMRSGQGAYYTADPIVVRGTISVGEEYDKGGYLMSIYRLSADRVN